MKIKENKEKTLRSYYNLVVKIDVTYIDRDKNYFIGNVIWGDKIGFLNRMSKLFFDKKVLHLVGGIQLGINYLYCEIVLKDVRGSYNTVKKDYKVIDTNDTESDLYKACKEKIERANKFNFNISELGIK